MTNVATAPTTTTTTYQELDKDAVTNALVASGGNVPLLVEQLTRKLKRDVTSSEVIQAFIDKASDVKIQDAVKAMMMLTFLQLLNELKDHAISALPEYSPSELMATMKMIVEGITQLMPTPQSQASAQPIQILQQFLNGAEQSRSRVMSQLEQYRENDPENFDYPST